MHIAHITEHALMKYIRVIEYCLCRRLVTHGPIPNVPMLIYTVRSTPVICLIFDVHTDYEWITVVACIQASSQAPASAAIIWPELGDEVKK